MKVSKPIDISKKEEGNNVLAKSSISAEIPILSRKSDSNTSVVPSLTSKSLPTSPFIVNYGRRSSAGVSSSPFSKSYPENDIIRKSSGISEISSHGSRRDSILERGMNERWMLPAEDVLIYFDQLIGKAKSANEPDDVYRGKWRSMNVAVKVKRPNLKSFWLDQLLEAEIHVLATFRHPSIIQFLGVSYIDIADVESVPIMVLEEAPFGSLSHFSQTHSEDMQRNAVKWGLEVALGMNYLHSFPESFLHLALDPSHILVCNDGHVKISGFAYGSLYKVNKQHVKMMQQEFGIPQSYTAPEFYEENRTFAPSVDVYSFGLCLYFMATGLEPVPGKRIELNKVAPKALQYLIEACIDPNPTARPVFSTVVEELEVLAKPRKRTSSLGLFSWLSSSN